MAAKEISVKRYVVRLSTEEREQLEALIRKGKSSAQRLLKARILLKADVSDAGEGWSDIRIIKALETSVSMVYRVRKQLVEEGLEAVLSRKQRATPAVPGDARAGRCGYWRTRSWCYRPRKEYAARISASSPSLSCHTTKDQRGRADSLP